MNKLLLLISLIFFSLAIMTNFLFKVNEPSWQNATIDPDRARRFVTVLANNHTPAVLYFDEKNLGGVLYTRKTIQDRFYGSSILDRLAPTPSIKALLNDIYDYFTARQWSTQTIDTGEQMGLFLTGVYDDRGILHAVYQDGTLGKEVLYYAYFDGKKWSKKEIVDDATQNGINIGVFASISIINGSPVIFYHTEQGQKFGYAIRITPATNSKSQTLNPKQIQNSNDRNSELFGYLDFGNSDLFSISDLGFRISNLTKPAFAQTTGSTAVKSDNWERKTLETGVGWLTTTANCDGSSDPGSNLVYVVYRSRDTQNIYLGKLEPTTHNSQPTTYNWSSTPLSASASTGLAITTKFTTHNPQLTTTDSPCRPYISYFAPVDNTGHGKISFYDSAAKKLSTIDDDGYLSRISLAGNKQGFHAVYNVENKGLFYAQSTDGVSWKTQLMAPGKYTGSYNSLTVDDDGNIYIAYVDGTALKYMEYNVSSSNTVKNVKTGLSITLLAIGILGLAASFMKKNTLQLKSKNRGK